MYTLEIILYVRSGIVCSVAHGVNAAHCVCEMGALDVFVLKPAVEITKKERLPTTWVCVGRTAALF